MDEIVVKNAASQIIGYIRVESNGNKTVMDFYKRILGRYDAGTDIVRDFNGRIVARGDAAALLLKDEL